MSDSIPEGWIESSLGSISSINMGQSPSSDTYNKERKGLPFFQGRTDFGNHYPRIRTWCSEPTKVAEKGSILFSVRAPVGDINVANTQCCIGRGLAAITGKKTDQSYLYQKISFVKSRFQLVAQGSTFEAINGSELRDFKLRMPPLPEQQKIAAILTSVDEVIEKIQAQIDKLKDLKTGMMQELLTKGVGIDGKPHTEFKDSPVGRIPKGWEVVTTDDISEGVMVGVVIKPTQYYTDSGIPALRSANVRESGLTMNNLKYFSIEANEVLKKSKLQLGDLLTVRTGYPGTSAVVTNEFVGANCIDVVITRPSADIIDTNFLCLWVNSDSGKGQVLKAQGGLAQQHFNVGDMRNLLVALPPINEQKQIVRAIESITSKIKRTEFKYHKLNNTKKALMQDLLTGKVRVNVASETSGH